MSSLVFLLEEASARNMLEAVVSRLAPPDVAVHYVTFEGKRDMERQLERKLRFWLEPDTCFIIMRDQDAEDCMAVKNRLLGIVERSGKQDASLVRIACHELESFFLGDLAAVAVGLGMPGLAKLQKKNPYRRADSIPHAAEELKKITGNRYQKLAGSRAIGPCLDLSGSNSSHSFKVLVDGISRQVRRLSAAV